VDTFEDADLGANQYAHNYFCDLFGELRLGNIENKSNMRTEAEGKNGNDMSKVPTGKNTKSGHKRPPIWTVR
jgi:hypothetical protein